MSPFHRTNWTFQVNTLRLFLLENADSYHDWLLRRFASLTQPNDHGWMMERWLPAELLAVLKDVGA